MSFKIQSDDLHLVGEALGYLYLLLENDPEEKELDECKDIIGNLIRFFPDDVYNPDPEECESDAESIVDKIKSKVLEFVGK